VSKVIKIALATSKIAKFQWIGKWVFTDWLGQIAFVEIINLSINQSINHLVD